MFALPHVEAASHSFSHPFRWKKLPAGSEDEGYNLAIPGYAYDVDREVAGSVKYVESLLPKGKRCEVFLWTGDCNPKKETLEKTYQAGLLNMNGGETIMSRMRPSLTAVAPLGIPRDAIFQVYAPNQNENMYTNLWTGPFYGYERVIETFQLTDKPLRLKPINIYYHTYSASKPASLKALKKVYDWALSQPVLPLHASAYARKVLDFNEQTLAREGEWLAHRGRRRNPHAAYSQTHGLSRSHAAARTSSAGGMKATPVMCILPVPPQACWSWPSSPPTGPGSPAQTGASVPLNPAGRSTPPSP